MRAEDIAKQALKDWRDANAVTDWEFGELSKLLATFGPRDLALKIVRLEGQLCVQRQLAMTLPPVDVDALATELWAKLDTEITIPGVLDHEQVLPLIKEWLADHCQELRRLPSQDTDQSVCDEA